MKFLIIPFAAGLTLMACSPKTTTAEAPVEMNFPDETVAGGYELYTNKCGRCHKLKTVDNYSREDWNGILPRMAKKAGLEGDQEQTIDAYINWELTN